MKSLTNFINCNKKKFQQTLSPIGTPTYDEKKKVFANVPKLDCLQEGLNKEKVRKGRNNQLLH